MSNPTPVPIVTIAPAAPAAPPVTLDSIVDGMKAQAVKDYAKDPDSLTSPHMAVLLTSDGVQNLQQIGTQLTAIAAAFTPPAPVQTPLEGFAHAANHLAHAIYAPVAAMQGQIDDLNKLVARLEKALDEIKTQGDERYNQLGASVAGLSKEAIAARDGVKELRESLHADERKLAIVERTAKNTHDYLHKLHSELVNSIRRIEGSNERNWQELDILAAAIIEGQHDDGRGGPKRK